KALNEANIPLPHLGIRDRDDLSIEEIEQLEAEVPNLFVWRARSIENVMLSSDLIAATLNRLGRGLTPNDVEGALKALADRQLDEIHAELLEAELRRRHAYSKAGTTPLDRLKHHYDEVRRVADEKLNLFDDTADNVRTTLDQLQVTELLALSDGKRLLREA